ncbi:MAG: ABC transporter permease subunit, partial [Verrucomicrobiales bacterium]|nr:ABC transporter permease subunit [Verrucomicrobiales bacterium]
APPEVSDDVVQPKEMSLAVEASSNWWRRWTTLRDVPTMGESALLAVACVGLVFLVWHILTVGEVGQRLVNAYNLPSIAETFGSFRSLWFDRALTLSAVASLARVVGGFLMSVAIGVPLGVIAGSYLRVNAFLKPMNIFGRNIPIAALIPLTLMWFGIDEVQKVMFIFLASVAFVLFDATSAVQAVPDRYLDTAYTLGAHRRGKKALVGASIAGAIYAICFALGAFLLERSTEGVAVPETAVIVQSFVVRAVIGFAIGGLLWFPILNHQAIRHVLLPLALPDMVNSLRLLFGLAFGYIMLAEVINAKRGLGALITMSQRQGPREHIYLCLLIISMLAYGIDRLILWIQRVAFPHVKNVQN